MKKKVAKKEEVTNKDLGRMINALGSNLDLRITKLESYMKGGFNSLNDKMEYIDARFSHQIEGLGKRMDDFAENKVSKIFYKELENRVLALELKVLPRVRKFNKIAPS